MCSSEFSDDHQARMNVRSVLGDVRPVDRERRLIVTGDAVEPGDEHVQILFHRLLKTRIRRAQPDGKCRSEKMKLFSIFNILFRA